MAGRVTQPLSQEIGRFPKTDSHAIQVGLHPMVKHRPGTQDAGHVRNSNPSTHELIPMKSHHTPGLLALRLPLLLVAGLFALSLSASADDRGHGHGNNHHFNPHFNGHPPGHAYGHGNYNNFKQYNHHHGYYPGYYNDYPAYSPNYRGQSYYNNSNYDQTNHRTLLNMLLNR